MNRGGGGFGIRAIIAVVLALGAVITYFTSTQTNPVTGEKQRVTITADQEVALGLQSAPEMARQFGGLADNPNGQKLVDRVGQSIVERSDAAKSPYRFEFHLLDDDKTVNAFALPGGQIFVTEALARALRTEGELAGVLGHEIGHVVGRHSAEHLAKQQLTQGIVSAVAVGSESYSAAQVAQMVGSVVNMKHGREDELESDRLGVKYLAQAGYDPRALVGVMEVLAKAGGGRGGSEFFSTHPNPENRIGKIKQAVQDLFPKGVPANLKR